MQIQGEREDGVLLLGIGGGQVVLLNPDLCEVSPPLDAVGADEYGPWMATAHTLDRRRELERLLDHSRMIPFSLAGKSGRKGGWYADQGHVPGSQGGKGGGGGYVGASGKFDEKKFKAAVGQYEANDFSPFVHDASYRGGGPYSPSKHAALAHALGEAIGNDAHLWSVDNASGRADIDYKGKKSANEIVNEHVFVSDSASERAAVLAGIEKALLRVRPIRKVDKGQGVVWYDPKQNAGSRADWRDDDQGLTVERKGNKIIVHANET